MVWWRRGTVQPIRGLHEVRRQSIRVPEDADWISRLPRADIANCIAFSKLRCFLSLVSLLLLASDIPRTGLGVALLSQYYSKPLAPGSAIFFGPYAYPVLNIACNSSGSSSEDLKCAGVKGGNPIAQVPAWSYGFDTTSIGLRGAVELFNVSSFPEYLAGQGNDPRRGDPMASMDLSTAFCMLDDLVRAIQAWRHPVSRPRDSKHLVFERFATEHAWIDRLCHFLLRPLTTNRRWRVHAVNFFAKQSRKVEDSLDICSPTLSRAFAMPQWCGDFMKWTSYNFANKPMPGVSIEEHIEQRVRALQAMFPDLWLDMVLLSTAQPITTSSMTYSTFFHNHAWEIVVIIRGRECDPSLVNCTTKWVDDFRYERVVITTNVAEWYMVAAALRGSAQVYVWLHLFILLHLCVSVSPRRPSARRQSVRFVRELLAGFSTMLKIPFQVVVYGSYVPILLYVFALLTDGKFTDSFLASYWSTFGGANESFSPVNFIQTASIQMRNVWGLALLTKLWTYLQTRGSTWQHQDGILGVQGLSITFISFLSIFGPYKAKEFRDTSISAVTLLVQAGPGRSTRMSQIQAKPAPWLNANTFELGESISMTLLTLLSVLGLHIALVGLARLLARPSFKRIFFRYSMVVPFTAGSIFPTTALSVCFRAHLKRPDVTQGCMRGLRVPQIAPISTRNDATTGEGTTRLIKHCHPLRQFQAPRDALNKESVSGHGWERDLAERSALSMSVIQLMNVAMMSDPLTFLRLRALGIDLFVYKVYSTELKERSERVSDEVHSTALLPFPPSTIASKTGLDLRQYEMICKVDSRDLPIWVLLHCG